MKDEKYSDELVLPLVKVIKQERNFQESDEEFYGRKYKVMKILTLILFGIAFKSEVIGQKTIYKDNFGEISIVTYGLVDDIN